MNFYHTFINNGEKFHLLCWSPTLSKMNVFTLMIAEKNCELHPVSMQLKVGRKSIANKGCSVCNKLPDDIETITANETFRIRFKEVLFAVNVDLFVSVFLFLLCVNYA